MTVSVTPKPEYSGGTVYLIPGPLTNYLDDATEILANIVRENAVAPLKLQALLCLVLSGANAIISYFELAKRESSS